MNHHQLEKDIQHLEHVISHISAEDRIPLSYWRSRIELGFRGGAGAGAGQPGKTSECALFGSGESAESLIARVHVHVAVGVERSRVTFDE